MGNSDPVYKVNDVPRHVEKKRDIEENLAARKQDMADGRARGEELFREGSLGRVQEGRSQEISNIIARRHAESNGFSTEEQNAFRTNNHVANNQAL
jgi:hypothetical protein